MGDSAVHVSHRQETLVIELRGPGGFPRLTRAALAELHHCFDRARSDTHARAIVLTGTDKCFAAGADLAEVAALTPLEALRFSVLGQGLMNKIAGFPKPVIAAIRGQCLGGGFDLALACHLRIAATDAVFRHPGANLGILTGWGGTQRIPRLASAPGRARAVEALLAGDALSAVDAFRCGLVQRLTPPSATLPAALAMAHALSAEPRAPEFVPSP